MRVSLVRTLIVVLLCLIGSGRIGAAEGALSQVQVTVERGEPLALSPDGRWLVAIRSGAGGQELCRLQSDKLELQDCVKLPAIAIGPESLRWSPQSDRVAFTEDWQSYGDETDIWLYEPEAGAIRNLTDDSRSKADVGKPETNADRSPGWTADGSVLLFVRSVVDATGAWAATLMQVGIDGGTPREITRLGPFANPALAGVQSLVDGTILFPMSGEAIGNGQGLWSIGPCSTAPMQLLDARSLGMEAPAVVDVSQTGVVLLLDSGEKAGFVVYDPVSGVATPVVDAQSGRKVTAAALSPDGAWLLTVRVGGSPTGDLVLMELATGDEYELGTLARPLGDHPLSAGLTWATGGRLFAAGFGRSGELIDTALPVLRSPGPPADTTLCAS